MGNALFLDPSLTDSGSPNPPKVHRYNSYVYVPEEGQEASCMSCRARVLGLWS